MTLSHLSENECKVIHECMRAALEGPFFPEWEFELLFQISRDELAEILLRWPDLSDCNETNVRLAINNSMNNLVGYPHHRFDVWDKFLSVGPDEIIRIHKKWKYHKNGVSDCV